MRVALPQLPGQADLFATQRDHGRELVSRGTPTATAGTQRLGHQLGHGQARVGSGTGRLPQQRHPLDGADVHAHLDKCAMIGVYEQPRDDIGQQAAPIWNWVVTIHAILVAAPLVLFTFLILTAPGPNIGAGLVGSVVMALGLPWTLPVFWNIDQVNALPIEIDYLVKLGPAVLNVAIHVGIRFVFTQRRRRRPR